LAGTLVYLDVGSTSAVHESLDQRPAAERTAVVQTRMDQDDPNSQAALIDQVLTGSVDPEPLTWPALASGPRELTDHDGATVVLRNEPDLAPGTGAQGAVIIDDGAWPVAQEEGALHTGAAGALGLRPGDEVTIVSGDQEHRITVTALCEPRDANEERLGC